MTPRACHNFRVKLASLILTVTAGLNGQRLGMRAKNFVFNRGVSCFIRGVSCFIRGVSCFIRGVSCFTRCILSCFIRYNPVFQSWSSRRERVKRLKPNLDIAKKPENRVHELTDSNVSPTSR